MVADDTLLKSLQAGGLAPLGRGAWRPGVACSVRGQIVPCVRGLHYCRGPQILNWLSEELWLFEDLSPDETVDADNKLVTRRGRITEQVTAWDARTARLFAADCAERVLPIYERQVPGDDRPRLAVEAAQLFAMGLIGAKDLSAAWAADIAAAAAAVGDAACAARAAAWAAARDAARDADADAAAWAAERDWQWHRLQQYLNGETP